MTPPASPPVSRPVFSTVSGPRWAVSRWHPIGSLLVLVCCLGSFDRFGHAPEATAAGVPAAVLEAESRRIAVMEKAKDSVLAIFSASGGGGGSGVVISADGYALTNFHVAKPCGNALKCGMADGALYDAVIVGVDPTGDIALIKLFGRTDFPRAEFGQSDTVEVGDWAFAMGNPFLLATDFQPTVSYGIISGVHRYQYPSGTILEYTDCLQTDAAINPGNSGGPLYSAEGLLIGINGRASFEKRGRVSVGVGYAISINQIKNFLGHLKSGRIVDHATLGARVAFDADGRVVVSNVLESSDAYRRGLRYDDEIVRFGGRSIETPNGFKNVLGIYPKGWRVPLSFRREGKRYDVLVRLAGLHGEAELLAKTRGRRPMLPVPVPQPGDDPEPERPKSKKPEGRRNPMPPKDDEPKSLPIPHPKNPADGKAAVPAIVQEHFEPKRGYANYYFNRQHRRRVWEAFLGRGDFTRLDVPWIFNGSTKRGTSFRLELTDTGATLTLPQDAYTWAATDQLDSSPEPPASGGLFAALHLWRRLALLGPEGFGEVSYLGLAPLVGYEEPVDVLVGIHGGVETHFLFDPVRGHLVAIEMFSGTDVDPCELHFRDPREIDGRWLPREIEVRFGDERFATFHIETVDFLSPEPT